jgi:hypothetical protein
MSGHRCAWDALTASIKEKTKPWRSFLSGVSPNMATRTSNVRLLHKSINLFSRSLFLVIAIILIGAPVRTGMSAFANNVMSSHVALDFITCNGEAPGFCPDGPYVNT